MSVQWEDDEPYLELKEGYRLTPIRQSDAEDWQALINDPAVQDGSRAGFSGIIDLEQARQEIATFVTEDEKGLLALREGQRSHRAPFRTIRDPEGRCIGYCRLDPPLPPHVLPNLGPAELQAIAYPHFGYGLLSAYSGRGLGMAAARAMVEYSKEWIEDGYLGTGCQYNNAPSLAILKRLGFEHAFEFRIPWNVDGVDGFREGAWMTFKLR